ncbi:hypothetical protein NP493_79g05064 [Ridgeia piscesae]|uniref:Phospholysine phosphohistidine inorganic pyrophosphate phosphatase n=1 Tax=Ridgeia piscesae TaxID=27915 RepID=A0AAD9P8V1_RIDPI|nr:hypothetical protein NP493_79g05064 [Ridgeia piscesae]
MASREWYLTSSSIKGLLLDITGVLYNSGEGGGIPIKGSIDAIARLSKAGIPVRFCTNETQCTKQEIAGKLNRLGFSLNAANIFPPAPAVRLVAKQRGLRPHLLVHPGVLPEFSDVPQDSPNCVVVGDAAQEFSYENMNRAFQILMGMDKPILISMGMGKYYKEGEHLVLDLGPFTKALEYACDVKAEVVGKPSKMFFETALRDMGITADEALMIGDDIVSDVGGAQACGLRALQVRTGKYRPEDEPHETVTPDGYVDNLAQAVDLYLAHK